VSSGGVTSSASGSPAPASIYSENDDMIVADFGQMSMTWRDRQVSRLGCGTGQTFYLSKASSGAESRGQLCSQKNLPFAFV